MDWYLVPNFDRVDTARHYNHYNVIYEYDSPAIYDYNYIDNFDYDYDYDIAKTGRFSILSRQHVVRELLVSRLCFYLGVNSDIFRTDACHEWRPHVVAVLAKRELASFQR